MRICTVRRGDTLRAIAQRFCVPAAQIIADNQLENPAILCPGQALLLPDSSRSAQARRAVIVNGFAVSSPPAVLSEALPYLSYLSPFACRADAAGGLSYCIAPVRTSECCAARLLTVTNQAPDGSFSAAIAHAIVASQAVQGAFLQKIAAVLHSGGYYGVDLIFLGLYPFDRAAYSTFLRRLADVLHGLGALLVTVLAPGGSAAQSPLLSAGQDTAVLGEVSDNVILLSYDWGHIYGPPMAAAPADLVEQALLSALAKLPAEKLLLGLPCYGLDWSLPFRPGGEARIFGAASAITLAGAVGAEIRFCDNTKTPWFRYIDSEGRQHEVWFEDVRSLAAKYALVRKYSLAGVSFWNIDHIFQPAYLLLSSLFEVEKPF